MVKYSLSTAVVRAGTKIFHLFKPLMHLNEVRSYVSLNDSLLQVQIWISLFHLFIFNYRDGEVRDNKDNEIQLLSLENVKGQHHSRRLHLTFFIGADTLSLTFI